MCRDTEHPHESLSVADLACLWRMGVLLFRLSNSFVEPDEKCNYTAQTQATEAKLCVHVGISDLQCGGTIRLMVSF